MKKFHLTFKGGLWEVKSEKDEIGMSFPKGTTKRNAIKLAREFCINYYVDNDIAVSLIIHNKDGVIRSERTYPRSADPRRSKG